MFGGANEDGPLNDLFVWHEEEEYWIKLMTMGDIPPPIEMHSAHIWYKDDESPHLIVIGGRYYPKETGAPGFSPNIWTLDLNNLTWLVHDSTNSKPICSHASVLIGNRYLIMYGGCNGLTLLDYIVKYDLEEKKFLTYLGDSPFPEGPD